VKEAAVSEHYDADREVVGIDLHRRRSVVVRLDERTGELLGSTRIENSAEALVAEVGKAGPCPRVAVEATFGWYWAVDALRAAGAEVHLAHPRGLQSMKHRRVKNDERDARELADLLRVNRFAEAYIAPVELRELRELVRHRQKLVNYRRSLKASLHAVLGKCGVIPELGEMFGPGGQKILDSLALPDPYAYRVDCQRRLIAILEREIADVEIRVHRLLKDDEGYQALLRLKGIGPIFAAIFLAEIGDVHRFPSAEALASWCGLTPRHEESDAKVRRGHISKQGSRLLRWALIEACQRVGEPWVQAHRRRIVTRRGPKAKNIAKVAAARRLAHVVYYTLRDGEARCLRTAVAT
jgi:transposase